MTLRRHSFTIFIILTLLNSGSLSAREMSTIAHNLASSNHHQMLHDDYVVHDDHVGDHNSGHQTEKDLHRLCHGGSGVCCQIFALTSLHIEVLDYSPIFYDLVYFSYPSRTLLRIERPPKKLV